jgi:seryl-tRNA synthetase
VHNVTARLSDVYTEYTVLQQKMADLEKQAGNAQGVTLELQELKQSYEQIHKDLVRKQEKLEEVVAENHRLHKKLAETEDKLEEANLQRQQLFKKVQFLEDINADYQKISETNKKLQTEIRRVAELESMLRLIQEERDQLLRKRSE